MYQKQLKIQKQLRYILQISWQSLGQTDNYSISDHLEAIFEHAGREVIDYCLADTGEIVPEYVRRYNLEGSDVVGQDIEAVTKKGVKIIQKHLAKIDGDYIRHNSDSIATTVMELIGNDLKYRDKQATPQYMYLNSVLEDEKKLEKKRVKSLNKNKKEIEKNKEKARSIQQKNKHRKPSKFNTKYRDRIESIQTSSDKKNENLKLYKEMEKLDQKNSENSQNKEDND